MNLEKNPLFFFTDGAVETTGGANEATGAGGGTGDIGDKGDIGDAMDGLGDVAIFIGISAGNSATNAGGALALGLAVPFPFT